MTTIFYGTRAQVLVDVEALGNYRLVRDIKDEVSFDQDWCTPTSPPVHLVFVDIPSKWDLTQLKPRPDRHLAFLDKTELTPKQLKWVKSSKVTQRYVPELTNDQLLKLLITGKLGLSLSYDAAKLLLTLRPRGLQSLYWPIEQLKDLEVPEPVTVNSMMSQWPVKQETDAYQIFRSLGSGRAIDLASKVSDKKAWGGIFVLGSMCKSRPAYLDYLEIAKSGIINKRWSPKVALQVFTHLCYLHEQHPDRILPFLAR